MSASVSGVGRLAIWEDAAAGLSAGYGHGTGISTATEAWRGLPSGVRDDEVRFDAWALVRVAEAWQLSARVPLLLGVREAGGDSAVGAGLGDVVAGVRWDAIGLGEYAELPGVALTLSAIAPAGRRPEEVGDALGASATGRGAWGLAAGLAVERAVVPWFVRADADFTWLFGFRRADTRAWQQLGPSLDVGLTGGRELVADVLVLALAVRWAHEWPMAMAGQTLPDSSASSLSTALSASWKVTQRWTVTGAVATDALGRLGVARNRPERLTATLGVRHAFF